MYFYTQALKIYTVRNFSYQLTENIGTVTINLGKAALLQSRGRVNPHIVVMAPNVFLRNSVKQSQIVQKSMQNV